MKIDSEIEELLKFECENCKVYITGNDIQELLTQRKQELLAVVRGIVGEDEVCPCDKGYNCPINRINDFRAELRAKLGELEEKV